MICRCTSSSATARPPDRPASGKLMLRIATEVHANALRGRLKPANPNADASTSVGPGYADFRRIFAGPRIGPGNTLRLDRG